MDLQRQVKPTPWWRKYWYLLPLLIELFASYYVSNLLGEASYVVDRRELVAAKVEQVYVKADAQVS